MPESLLPTDDFPATSLRPVAMPKGLAPHRRVDAMAAFQGALYLGLAPAAGQAAAIWRLDPVTLAWQPVLDQTAAPDRGRRRPIQPSVLPSDFPAGSLPGQDAGFVAMVVFQGAGDAAPCLYVATQGLTGARLLRSADGRVFAAVLTVPAAAGYLGLTALAVWGDRLVMTSGAHLPDIETGAHRGAEPDGVGLPRGCVLGSRDPAAADQWQVLSPTGFDDPDNLAISALAVHQGRLCAGTANPAAGFQIWTCDADDGPGIPGWSRLMSQGATRHGMNPQVALLASHHGHLWIGTAMDSPPVEALDWPAAELLRIEPDGAWELIAGEARLTPQGLRLPLSLLGPGLEDPGVTRLGVMTALPDAGLHGGLVLGGGPLAGLWISRDGETWQPLGQGGTDEDGEDEDAHNAGGVTAMVAAEGRLWIAVDGRLFGLEHAG